MIIGHIPYSKAEWLGQKWKRYTTNCWFLTDLSARYCLFVYGFSFHSSHLYWDVTITGEGLQNLTYAWHLWPLSSEGSLDCRTYCDLGHLCIINGHLRGLVTLTLIAGCFSRTVTSCLNDLGLSRLGFEHPTFRLRDKRYNRLLHRFGPYRSTFK